MNDRIIDFISNQKVATVCLVDEQSRPYCFSCFYAFDSRRQLLYFKSSSSTHHGALLLKRPAVGGTIQPDKLNTLAIKGIQFTGVVFDATNPLASDAKSLYHLKHPIAVAMPGEVWTIQLHSIKMTDNTLNFGKKILWERSEEPIAR